MKFFRKLFGKNRLKTIVKNPTSTTSERKPRPEEIAKKTPPIKRKPREAVLKQYSCNICGRELAGEDLVYAKKYEKDARVFYKDRHAPGVPSAIIKVSNTIDKLFYCQECLSNIANWKIENKPCLNCKSLLLNFVRLPGIPDFYCQAHGNQAINNPRTYSCPEWQLRVIFKR